MLLIDAHCLVRYLSDVGSVEVFFQRKYIALENEAREALISNLNL